MAKKLSKKEIAQQVETAAKDYLNHPNQVTEHVLDCMCFIICAKNAMGDKSVETCNREINTVSNLMELINTDKIKQQ